MKVTYYSPATFDIVLLVSPKSSIVGAIVLFENIDFDPPKSTRNLSKIYMSNA